MTFTLQQERKEDQIRTYVLIERSSGRRFRTPCLILLLIGALIFLALGWIKHGRTTAMKTLFESRTVLSRG